MVLRYLLKSTVLPPLLQLLMLLAAVLVWRRFPKLARTLAVLSVVSLWLLATPWVAHTLIGSLSNDYPHLDPAQLGDTEAEAIVILAGGMQSDSPEFGAPVATSNTLVRLRYGAFVHRETRLPILVSGGRVFEGDDQPALAEVMAQGLEQHFRVSTRWLEQQSRTTYENARYSAELLAEQGIDRVLLVTEGFHMPRAVLAFERLGLTVVPAPTQVQPAGKTEVLDWVPSALALYTSSLALHEYYGLWVYRLQS